MEKGGAAQELIAELRLVFTLTLFVQHMCSDNFVYDRSDTSLDFIAVYNASNNFTPSVSLLQRTGADECISEEPLAQAAALEIQSTRASMLIEGKMLLGITIFFPFCNCHTFCLISYYVSLYFFCVV